MNTAFNRHHDLSVIESRALITSETIDSEQIPLPAEITTRGVIIQRTRIQSQHITRSHRDI